MIGSMLLLLLEVASAGCPTPYDSLACGVLDGGQDVCTWDVSTATFTCDLQADGTARHTGGFGWVVRQQTGPATELVSWGSPDGTTDYCCVQAIGTAQATIELYGTLGPDQLGLSWLDGAENLSGWQSYNNDTWTCTTFDAEVFGRAGADVIDGTHQAVCIDQALFGDDGNDVIFGHTEAEIYGGHGHDAMFGSESEDYVDGHDGHDLAFAFEGDDTLEGGEGYDILVGNQGDDTIYGGGDNDAIKGGRDDDHLYGEDGDDWILGDLYGDGSGADHVDGGFGNDRLYGGGGPDELHGGSGNDAIGGGAGSDELYGGDGADHLCADDQGLLPDRLFGDDDILTSLAPDTLYSLHGYVYFHVEPRDGCGSVWGLVPHQCTSISEPTRPASCPHPH